MTHIIENHNHESVGPKTVSIKIIRHEKWIFYSDVDEYNTCMGHWQWPVALFPGENLEILENIDKELPWYILWFW